MRPNVPGTIATLPSVVNVKTATGNIGPHEVSVVADSTAGAMTLTMPDAAKALPNTLYVVWLAVRVGNLTVSYGVAPNPAAQVITIVNGYVVAVSDGVRWYPVASQLA